MEFNPRRFLKSHSPGRDDEMESKTGEGRELMNSDPQRGMAERSTGMLGNVGDL